MKAGPPRGERVEHGRMAVLDTLRKLSAPASVQELADRVGLHANTVRFHLAKLMHAGLVAEVPGQASGPGRPRAGYQATEPAARSVTKPRPDQYRLLAQILSGFLASKSDDPRADARSAGRQWGRYLIDKTDPYDRPDQAEIMRRITEMLDKLGFAPQAQAGGDIFLHHCPFKDVADRYPGVVCSVHLGLLQGAMDELGGNPEATSLEPLAAPQLCIVSVSD